MQDTLTDIKQQDLLQYIEKVTGTKAEHLTDDEYRINPCPFCGHKDQLRKSSSTVFYYYSD